MVMLIGLGVENYVPLYVQTARGRSVEFAAFSLVFLSGVGRWGRSCTAECCTSGVSVT